jgi:glycosyltransferase involved in cell wall biosynthesis
LRSRRVLVLAVQTPFADGGAERHVRRLTEELRKRDVEADLVSIPLAERERFDLVRGAVAWRSLDLTEAGGKPVDAVIATRFPSYAVRHPNKLVWLIHQYRQAYDQFGTPYSDFTSSPEDRRTREVIAEIDRVGLSEARKVFANSQTVASRLYRFNRIRAEPLYHPPPLVGRYRSGPLGNTVLWVGRLDQWKRPALLLDSLPHAPEARAVFVGGGAEEERLRRRSAELGVESRVRWVRNADEETLLSLYAEARIVAVTAAGEDLGYVPLEAFLSGKPVLTTEDAGGPLEFVRDGETGLVVAPRPEALGVALRLAWPRLDALTAMGEAGRRKASLLNWDEPISRLLAAAGLAQA